MPFLILMEKNKTGITAREFKFVFFFPLLLCTVPRIRADASKVLSFDVNHIEGPTFHWKMTLWSDKNLYLCTFQPRPRRSFCLENNII